jgi:hypothetical protein
MLAQDDSKDGNDGEKVDAENFGNGAGGVAFELASWDADADV